MIRKIIRLGTSTLVTSLPSRWIKEHSLKQGDEIVLEEEGKSLRVSTTKSAETGATEINITDLDTKLVDRFIRGAYIKGFSEIRVVFQNQEVKELKTGKTHPTVDIIQKTVNSLLIGMEIIEQRNNSCTIKDITGHTDNELENIQRRIFLLTQSMGETCLELVRSKDKNIRLRSNKENIFRFTNYCHRLLNIKGHTDYKNVSFYYIIIEKIKETVDAYEAVANDITELKTQPSENTEKILELTNECLRTTYELFYKFSSKKCLELIKKRREAFDVVNKAKTDKTTKNIDFLMIGRLTDILFTTLYIAEARIGIEF